MIAAFPTMIVTIIHGGEMRYRLFIVSIMEIVWLSLGVFPTSEDRLCVDTMVPQREQCGGDGSFPTRHLESNEDTPPSIPTPAPMWTVAWRVYEAERWMAGSRFSVINRKRARQSINHDKGNHRKT